MDAVGVDESSFPGLSGEQKIIATFLSDLLPCCYLAELCVILMHCGGEQCCYRIKLDL